MRTLFKIILVIALVGAINWGLIGLFDFNLVNYLFSFNSALEKIIYIIVGLAGLISFYFLFDRIDD